MTDFTPEQLQRMCEGKRSYTKREAQEAANWRSGKRGRTRRPQRNVRIYQCPNGNDHYHITSKVFSK